ncbi:hypothetical protein ACEWY4_010371 [Coilia grayii]|uniref:DUF4537 domain-containing protein n=1 Tax=Coilia grayii TaxID=363190 RepID=A0ABD1K1R3_9TELE
MATMYVKSQASEASIIPVLIGMRQRSTTFIVDTSEAMSAILGPVKDLLIQVLLAKASLRDSLFNIICYSYKVTKWKNVCVTCTPDTVFEALGWIHSLNTCPGSDLLAAVEAAFSDPHCQAIHLLTSTLPDHPELFLRGLSTMTLHPVHVFFLSFNPELDSRTLDFLQCVTSATGGSCHLLLLSKNGSIDKASVLFAVNSAVANPRCYVESCYDPGRTQAPAVHAVPVSTHIIRQGNAFAPIITCGSDSIGGCSQFYPGCRVLARKEVDGLYYLGTITEQILDHRGVFLVEFDKRHPKDPPESCTSAHQLVCPPDMVHHTRAHAHSLMPGDALLAPWGPELWKYGPGRVLMGSEPRDPLRVALRSPLRVVFWNGVEASIPPELAVWIPPSQYEHIVKELQHPLHNLQFTPHCAPHCAIPVLRTCCHIYPVSCCHSAAYQCRCLCPATPLRSLCLPNDRHFLTEEQSQREELDRKVDLQLQDLQVSTTHTTSSQQSEWPAGLELVSQGVNTDLSFLGRTKTEPEDRTSWSYWRRSPAEPHHKKPGLVTTGSVWPVDICAPQLPMSGPINQSSVFEMVPGSAGRKATIKEIFSLTQPKLLEGGKTMQEHTKNV